MFTIYFLNRPKKLRILPKIKNKINYARVFKKQIFLEIVFKIGSIKVEYYIVVIIFDSTHVFIFFSVKVWNTHTER